MKTWKPSTLRRRLRRWRMNWPSTHRMNQQSRLRRKFSRLRADDPLCKPASRHRE
jgi:hypothetical protein